MHALSRCRPALRGALARSTGRSASSSAGPLRPPAPPPNFGGAPTRGGAIVSDKLARGAGAKPATVNVTEKAGAVSEGKKGVQAEEQPSRPPPEELLTVLQETIKTHGPLPVSRYMTLCLSHPTLGYYTTRKVFGKEGDFVTSPEISQVFGELLGIWFVTQWLAQGSPHHVRLVEFGPGRGTLLADILRTFRSLPAHSRPPVTSLHLVETSPLLRNVQKSAIAQVGHAQTPTTWYGDVKEVSQAKEGAEGEMTMLIAHEFFDALPIHVFENTQKGWREVLVDVADPKAVTTPSTPSLRLVLAPSPTPASAMYSMMGQLAASSGVQAQPDLLSASPAPKKAPSPLNVDTTLGASGPPSPSPTAPGPQALGAASLTAQRFARLPIGSRIEVSPASWEIARDVAQLIGAKGAGLVVDYGDAKAFGRSWRGFRKHQVVDPLTEPGHTDLTANVDFSYIAEAMSDFATTHGPLPQSRFLTSLGLQPRLASLLRNAPSEERRKEIESAARRLVDEGVEGMGGQYRVMGVTPKKGKHAAATKEGEDVFPFDLK
ncbi:hypothetical protein JCM6882_000941 [Rhodosporidiobolus microsporus]